MRSIFINKSLIEMDLIPPDLSNGVDGHWTGLSSYTLKILLNHNKTDYKSIG